jgi:hypothetical protein
MKASLCILAHNGHEEAAKLIEQFKAMPHLDLEVVVGAQGCCDESLEWYTGNVDAMVTVTDRELWDHGFGYCRQKIADAAERDWIISADLGEVWHLNSDFDSLDQVLLSASPSAILRVMRGDPEAIRAVVEGHQHPSVLHDDNGRIFDRRELQWVGIIHEALFHIGTGEVWAVQARRQPPAFYVEHGGKAEEPKDFVSRKEVLYDHLIHELVTKPKRRGGTHHYWWTAHWNVVVEPRFKEISFEEWQEMGG